MNNIVVVSDIHAGCRLALCPPEGAPLDDGGVYMPSPFQFKLWSMWREFWDKFVPDATRKEPYDVVIDGDATEGVHHRATTPISHNIDDQKRIAIAILKPIAERVKKIGGKFYMIRGTEAHVGPSGVFEEEIARELGAVRSAEGQYARYELWKEVGPKLVHLLHHVGTTGSQAYEATAVHKELVESFAESARWGRRPPDVIVRGHRHRHIETTIATGRAVASNINPLLEVNHTSRATAVVLPGWQGKTPFAWKIPGARLSTPQFGGIVIRWAKDELFIRSKVWTVERSATE